MSRILFICGSRNQTTQMHQISRHLRDHDLWFTPYFVDEPWDWARQLGMLDFSIGGNTMRQRCLRYLEEHRLAIDIAGRDHQYDLVVTCSDLIMPRKARETRAVLVQEGIFDPKNVFFTLTQRIPHFPRWVASTSVTGLSHAYERFCVASDGYRDDVIANGCDPKKVIVTGIPNFDDCARYRINDFPHRGYVLVATSDTRETFKRDDRPAFIRRAAEIARGRRLIFKLHPNEQLSRSRAEIHAILPDAMVVQDGSCEEMIANADVLVCQYSSTAFVGIALGKEVHSYFPETELRRLLPVQNRSAAANISNVCREVLGERVPQLERASA